MSRFQGALLTAAALLGGCSGEQVTAGFEEPLRALDTQFREGDLPGLPPRTAEEINAGVSPTFPTVTSVTIPNTLIPQGEPDRRISGRASDDSTAVAVKLEGKGSGYWLLPTGSEDVVNNGELEWSFRASFAHDLEPGLQRLLFAAIDAEGKSGTQTDVQLCIARSVPDNGNACDPKTAPPAFVVSLAWDADVDLDLRVINPFGEVVDPKHPSSGEPDEKGNIDPKQEGAGVIARDAFAHCQAAGPRRENLVFQTPPAPGTYLIYANLFDSCAASSVRFDVSLHAAVEGPEPDTFTVQETFHQAGELLRVHENGGAKLGLFVTPFEAN
jgi:hypothetical protein